jgi:hypothetical protein
MSARSPQSALGRSSGELSQNGGRRLAIPTWWRHARPLMTVCRASGANRAGSSRRFLAQGDCSVRVDVRLRHGCGVLNSILGRQSGQRKAANKDEFDRSADRVDALSSTRRHEAVGRLLLRRVRGPLRPRLRSSPDRVSHGWRAAFRSGMLPVRPL